MKEFIRNSFLEMPARFLLSLSPLRYRLLDRDFHAFLSLLRRNETLSLGEMREYQFSRFRELVRNAYAHSGFYAAKYREAGFHPDQLQDYGDIRKVPFLTKDEVRRHSKSMVLGTYRQKPKVGYTSGTTGKALTLYCDQRTYARDWAAICYQWERVGYRPVDGRVEFRGFLDGGSDYKMLLDERILRVNIIRMSETNIERIVRRINGCRYEFFHGYPSAIYKLALLLKAHGLGLRPKAILLASEVLYDWQMEAIDAAFPDARKIIHYGQAERVVMGAWTDARTYSFLPTYGLMEIHGENGEIVGTSFINEVMPLIRYRMTDCAEGFREGSSIPGKSLYPTVERIVGRQEDFTYTSKGVMVPPALVTFPFKKLHHIKAAKIIQHAPATIDLIMESDGGPAAAAEGAAVIGDLKRIYGEDAEVRAVHTDRIPLDKSGKFRWIECRIKGR